MIVMMWPLSMGALRDSYGSRPGGQCAWTLDGAGGVDLQADIAGHQRVEQLIQRRAVGFLHAAGLIVVWIDSITQAA